MSETRDHAIQKPARSNSIKSETTKLELLQITENTREKNIARTRKRDENYTGASLPSSSASTWTGRSANSTFSKHPEAVHERTTENMNNFETVLLPSKTIHHVASSHYQKLIRPVPSAMEAF